jgi:HAD superfamily hydrolase (TIGR01484 family)
VKKLIVFDLDGTLAISKQAIDAEMAGWLARLLTICPICVISGGDWPQFQKQVVDQLEAGAKLENLYLMPTTGAKFYRFDGAWKQIYADNFSETDRQRVSSALKCAITEAGFDHEQTWGDQIEDRGTQITFSGLGQEAPIEAKDAWDPDRKKRTALKTILDKSLNDLSVRIGGSTSIDITRPGIDKAYGVRKLGELTGVALDQMLFVGDALYPGGNDTPARDAGVPTIGVRTIDDTKRLIETIVTFAT